VLEKSGRWAAALRRAAEKLELPIGEVRSLEQVGRELAEQSAAIVALEIGLPSLVRMTSQLALWRTRFAAARFVLLADSELAPLDPMLRDAGAVHIVYATRDLAATVRLIRRHLARVPQLEMTLEESIVARLPWPAPS
jgi:hypothetical protein